jgi:hypothetical protein
MSFVVSLAATAQVQTSISLPPHSSVLTGNVRGYYFEAPTCFTITGVMVPTDVSSDCLFIHHELMRTSVRAVAVQSDCRQSKEK